MVEINVVGDFNANLENKFNKDIVGLKKGDTLLANITSHGGEAETLKRMAATIYGLKQNGVTFVTFVPEYADSCGFFLFLLGDHREIAEKATVHYHAPRVDMGGVFTKHDLMPVVEELTAYQDFTSSIFRAASNVSDELFAVFESSELPMNRANLVTLGIIN